MTRSNFVNQLKFNPPHAGLRAGFLDAADAAAVAPRLLSGDWRESCASSSVF